jgi:hypothetical protein
MSEWWTYHLSDFLLFSRSTYYRLFEIYNAAIWPAQVVAVALGLVILAPLWRRGGEARGRVIAAILAGCWLWIGIAFHASRYATINWAAVYFAWAFGVEAALLIWIGVVRGSLRFDRLADGAGRAGLAIFLFALALEPLIGPLLGRGWRQVEIFGVAPDPTAVATLGILVAARCRGRWLLMIVPALWCAITGAALLAMKAPAFWVPPVAAALSAVVAASQAQREARRGR